MPQAHYDAYHLLTEARQRALFEAINHKKAHLDLACKLAEVSPRAVALVRDRVERGQGSAAEETFILKLDAALGLVELGHVETMTGIFQGGEMGAVKAGELLLKATAPETWGGVTARERALANQLQAANVTVAKVKSRVAKRLEKDDLDKRANRRRGVAVFPPQALEQMSPEAKAVLTAEFERLGLVTATPAEVDELAKQRNATRDEEIQRLADELGISEEDMC